MDGKSTCNIPVSIGELWDKYTILLIKRDKITDEVKLKHVNNEIFYLEPYIAQFGLEHKISDELRQCNNTLWEIEDNIRDQERMKNFDDTFIKLARSVYIKNDERAAIKHKINIIFNSEIHEVKNYKYYK